MSQNTKMNVLRVILILVSVSFVQNDDGIGDTRVRAMMTERKRYLKVRCSRRFTPGSCLEPVRPVWTFVAPLQTCTERLGCPSGVFTNRFNSYEDCRTMCSDLVYLFMYLQSLDNDTFRVPDEGLESSTRQANVDLMYSEFMQQNQDYKDSEEQLADRKNANDGEDFRRSFHEALSNLPEEPDSEERPYKSSRDRAPTLSRRELVADNDLNVPDADLF